MLDLATILRQMPLQMQLSPFIWGRNQLYLFLYLSF